MYVLRLDYRTNLNKNNNNPCSGSNPYAHDEATNENRDADRVRRTYVCVITKVYGMGAYYTHKVTTLRGSRSERDKKRSTVAKHGCRCSFTQQPSQVTIITIVSRARARNSIYGQSTMHRPGRVCHTHALRHDTYNVYMGTRTRFFRRRLFIFESEKNTRFVARVCVYCVTRRRDAMLL